MTIQHVALWTKDLEGLKSFYSKYFGAKAGNRYVNKKKGFSSYFLDFGEGAKLEIMAKDEVLNKEDSFMTFIGYNHMAVAVPNKVQVQQITEQLEDDGYTVVSMPRVTGDGYYESVILDPEGNRVEITC